MKSRLTGQKEIKYWILSILFVVFSFRGSAQKIKFTDSTNKWIIYVTWLNGTYLGGMEFREYTNDSLVTLDSLVYRQFYPSGLIREDTIARKVYYRSNASDEEKVLYDYNLNIGDTFRMKKSPTASFLHIVVHIDSTLIRNVWHKIWYLKAGNSQLQSYAVVEGIGCMWDVKFPLWPYIFFEHTAHVICFQTNNDYPAMNPPVVNLPNDLYCNTFTNGFCLTGISEPPETSLVKVVPSPMYLTARIVFPNRIGRGELIIRTNTGAEIFRRQFVQRDDFEIAADVINTPGIFFFQLNDVVGNRIYRGKIVKQ